VGLGDARSIGFGRFEVSEFQILEGGRAKKLATARGLGKDASRLPDPARRRGAALSLLDENIRAAGDDRHDPTPVPGPDVPERMLAAARRRRGGLVK